MIIFCHNDFCFVSIETLKQKNINSLNKTKARISLQIGVSNWVILMYFTLHGLILSSLVQNMLVLTISFTYRLVFVCLFSLHFSFQKKSYRKQKTKNQTKIIKKKLKTQNTNQKNSKLKTQNKNQKKKTKK
jgi:choline-glycine betaine transporter